MAVQGSRRQGTKKAIKETKGKGKKKATESSKVTRDGLNPRKYSRIKQEFFEVDYANKLSKKDKEWLAKFQWEELGANVENAKFNKSKKDKRKVYHNNNTRNRDIYSHLKATNRVIDLQPMLYNDQSNVLGGENYEEYLIDYIDSKKADKH